MVLEVLAVAQSVELLERSVLQAVEQKVPPQAVRLLPYPTAPVNSVWKTLPSP